MSHLHALDAYRALAVVIVFLFHFYRTAPDAPLLWTQGGPLGVDIFFVLSGFLLTYSIIRAKTQGIFNLRDYWKRRIARIVPAYYVVMLAVIVTGILLFKDIPSLGEVVTHMLFIHNFWPAYHGSLFSVEWTLGVEMQFYIVLPLIVGALLYSRWTRWMTMIALLAVSIVYKAVLFYHVFPQVTVWDKFIWGTQLLGRIDQFLLGALACLCFLVWQRRRDIPRLASYIAGAGWLLSLGLGVYMFFLYGAMIHTYWEIAWAVIWWPTLFGVVIASNMLCTLILAARYETSSPVWRIVQWIALYSYGIYLWHQPVMNQVAPMGWTWHYDFAVTAVSTILLAVLSYHMVEKPIMDAVGRKSIT